MKAEAPVPYQILGGAGPDEAAAIVAAIRTVLAEEEAAAAAPSRRLVPGPWVLSARPRLDVTPVQLPAPGPLDWLPEEEMGEF